MKKILKAINKASKVLLITLRTRKQALQPVPYQPESSIDEKNRRRKVGRKVGKLFAS